MDENDRELTPEEAQAAWDAAEPVPISEERIREIVDYVLRRQAETYDVAVFHEVYSDRDRDEVVHENLRTRIRAAGLDPEAGTGSLHYHPDQGVFVMVVTVIRTSPPHGPRAAPGGETVWT